MIPREGVESELSLMHRDAELATVIPREGVESPRRKRGERGYGAPQVIPREGVERESKRDLRHPRNRLRDPERGS